MSECESDDGVNPSVEMFANELDKITYRCQEEANLNMAEAVGVLFIKAVVMVINNLDLDDDDEEEGASA